jgi:hypothetical protein
MLRFINNAAQKFPNTMNKEPFERPWDVAEPRSITHLEKPEEENPKRMIQRSESIRFILSFTRL